MEDDPSSTTRSSIRIITTANDEETLHDFDVTVPPTIPNPTKNEQDEVGGVLTTQVHNTQQQQQQQQQPQQGRGMLFHHEENLLIAVRELQHLFVDPPKNPFSPYEVELMGESGLQRIVRLLSSTSAGALAPFYHVGHKHKRIIVLLPPDTIILQQQQLDGTTTTNNITQQQQAREALTRYCALKITDNQKELFIIKRQAGRLLTFGLGMLLVCMSLSVLFSSDQTPNTLWAATLAEGFNIIGWVLLWHPFEAFLYDPIPLRIESRVYTFLSGLQLEVPYHNTNKYG
jgi:hypothetical protein